MLRLLLLVLFAGSALTAQSTSIDLQTQIWPAEWITVPNTDGTTYGIQLFRKTLDLPTAPTTFPVFVTADNQYELFVNGESVRRGPNRGDLDHWYYDSIDLAPFLTTGANTLAARVVNFGKHRPIAQHAHRTAFLLQSATEVAAAANTDGTWSGTTDDSYQPVPVNVYGIRPGTVGMNGYYVAGPGDRVDIRRHLRSLATGTSGWWPVEAIGPGIPKAAVGADVRQPWRLLPSSLPPMGHTPEPAPKIRPVDGAPATSNTVRTRVAPNTETTILLDQGYLTNAYPTFQFLDGEGATVTIVYAEALYEEDLRTKNNRNEIDGKIILGRQDTVLLGPAEQQSFTPLSYRTYRYIELRIRTADEALTLDTISSEAVGYPFDWQSQLTAGDPQLQTILDVGQRTARLCAMDHYMDCPYWEQLQYIGDTRIQAMVTLYNTGDERLVKHALDLMDYSRQPEGITLSRYPSTLKQIIGPFSLWYVGMLYDYMWYGSDRKFVQDKLPGIRQVIDYFYDHQAADGSLQNLPNWSYTDWVNDWPRGIPPIYDDGFSSVLDLQLLLALQHAQKLETELGMPAFAADYQTRINQLAATIRRKYWNAERGLFADTPAHDRYSQHANTLAILTGLVPESEYPALADKLLTEPGLAPASIYFRYYLHQALTKAGRGNDYLDWLDVWRTNLELGLTTWAEDSDVHNARSDCHAWGSSPNIEFFRTILGIDSASPHFRTVRIEPHLGALTKIAGEIPHPAGTIAVAYDLDAGEATVTLPPGVSGEFVWKGRARPLTGGHHTFSL